METGSLRRAFAGRRAGIPKRLECVGEEVNAQVGTGLARGEEGALTEKQPLSVMDSSRCVSVTCSHMSWDGDHARTLSTQHTRGDLMAVHAVLAVQARSGVR